MRKKSTGSQANPVDCMRQVLMKTIDDILLTLGLWKSEIEIRAKSARIDEKTEFLVDALVGMSEILQSYPTLNETFESKYGGVSESTILTIFLSLLEKKLWVVRSKILLLRKYVQQAQSYKRLMSVAFVIRGLKAYLEMYYVSIKELLRRPESSGVMRHSRTEYKLEEQNVSLKTSHTSPASQNLNENITTESFIQNDNNLSSYPKSTDSVFPVSMVPRSRSFGRSLQSPRASLTSFHSHSPSPSLSLARSPSSPPTLISVLQEASLSSSTSSSSFIPPKLTQRGGSESSLNTPLQLSSYPQRITHSQYHPLQPQYSQYNPSSQIEDGSSPPKVRDRSHSDNLRAVLESSSESVSTIATQSTNPLEGPSSMDNIINVGSEVSSQTDLDLPSSTPDSYSSHPFVLDEANQNQ